MFDSFYSSFSAAGVLGLQSDSSQFISEFGFSVLALSRRSSAFSTLASALVSCFCTSSSLPFRALYLLAIFATLALASVVAFSAACCAASASAAAFSAVVLAASAAFRRLLYSFGFLLRLQRSSEQFQGRFQAVDLLFLLFHFVGCVANLLFLRLDGSF